MDDSYGEFEPPEALARHVACVWSFEDGGAADPTPQRIVPDGCCELVVQHGEPYEQLTAGGRWLRQPTALFAGQLTRPLHLRATGPSGTTAVRFHPAGARAFAGRPMASLTNQVTPLDALHGPDAEPLIAAMMGAKDGFARRTVLSAYVAERLAGPTDGAVERCVRAIQASEGRIDVDALTRLSGLPPRTLQRRFADEVGASPRLLASIIRFRRVFDALRDETATSWTAAAQAAGYFDHPQMARDFRRFVGCTPTAFIASRNGLAASLVDLPGP